MIFRIKRKDRGFTQVDNKILENPNLSWKAKGLLTYFLSRPDNWRVRLADLEKRSTDGVTAIRSALAELERANYAKLELARAENGTLEGSFWSIYEEPDTGMQETSMPDDTGMQVSPTPDNPKLGKPHPNKTD